MKRSLLASYIAGITDVHRGESYSRIFKYFLPEFVTATIFLFCASVFDAWFIGNLKSTSLFATQGVTSILIHFIVKIAEGLLVGTVVMCGQYNGISEFEKVGKALVNAFWLTIMVGGLIGSILYFGAYYIYWFYGVPAKMIYHGIPLLRLKAVAIFLMFVSFAFIGFLRGIKNTRVPMILFMLGGIIFVLFDYILIFGKFGFQQWGLQGSALASIIQYSVILTSSLLYIFFDKDLKKYSINLWALFSWVTILDLLSLSWPVMIDKASLAWSQIWLSKMLIPMGKCAIASFTAVKELERIAILPAVAFAQVITFLVSNDYKLKNWDGIKNNIKKIIFIASIIVFTLLMTISLKPQYFIKFFDHKGNFTELACSILPIISILVFFDLLQLILSGALRGAADVKTVMITRLLVCFFCFMPMSWLFAHLNFGYLPAQFVMVYGSLYVGNALMSVVYIQRFRGNDWKEKKI
ncbi:MATE family efflux transporter [Candidatus Dependentiae bacterium]|nr:MATE family efflux transporter [Candidatus Dependentiae bacterium]